jgi:hypothetical protein
MARGHLGRGQHVLGPPKAAAAVRLRMQLHPEKRPFALWPGWDVSLCAGVGQQFKPPAFLMRQRA